MMKFAAARGNVRIGFDVIGRGMPVTLLHDFGENSGFWYESGWVKGCLARGRQVILVDCVVEHARVVWARQMRRGPGAAGASAEAEAIKLQPLLGRG
jgi:hypothetical protein